MRADRRSGATRSAVRARALPVVMALAALAGLAARAPAFGHGETHGVSAATFRCKSVAPLGARHKVAPTPPFASAGSLAALEGTDLWKDILSHLMVSLGKTGPCFGYSDQESWTKVVSRIPVDVVAVQVTKDRRAALVYVTGIPDYQMEMPKLFSSFKPGDTHGIFLIAARPTEDTRPTHDLADKGAIGIFVNGVSIFNYTDTFAYADKGLWSYDANVAEAPIVNADVSHATPSNLPQFPKGPGIYHNHQVSGILLHQLKDPFVAGRLEPSKLLGFAIDSNPIYGPIGYTSKDKSSGLKVLHSSYVPRAWLEKEGTGHRSSMPAWAVAGWDGSNASGEHLLNLFEKKKADVLYADGAKEGPVTYTGTDGKLAAEIEALQKKVGLKRDALGYVYWESSVTLPGGGTATTRNYLLKSSDLWGPDLDASILPASYQIADVDKFYFKAKLGTFAEDYAYVAGYGDLDFYNGIDSYLPDRGTSAYHYVTPFAAAIGDKNRMHTASFPYVIGIQYKSRVDPFNQPLDDAARLTYLSDHAGTLETVLDLGVTGKDDKGQPARGSVVELWQKSLGGD